jgi:hypothetical protein
MLLQKAKVEQSAAKVGVFGRQGSGKTTTAALMAMGLSKTYHGGAPIAFMDTENGSDYLVPIFEQEKVELLVIKSRSFKDMGDGLKEAQVRGCCAYLVDSYTHPWQELTSTFKAKSRRNKLEFHHMDALKTLWRDRWTDPMLNSPLHCILSGRLGFEWGNETDDEGNEKLIKLGTKLKSENEAGYEPSLLIEMESYENQEKRAGRKRGNFVHRATVLKDRWRSLNGCQFSWPVMNSYKVGDWEKVFKAFIPHWSKLAIGVEQKAVNASRNSSDLIPEPGQTSGQVWQQRRVVAAEEITGILAHIWPGQTANEKKIRQGILHNLFGTFSWTAIEAASVEKLERGVQILREFKLAADSRPPETPDAAVELLNGIVKELFGEIEEPAEEETPATA